MLALFISYTYTVDFSTVNYRVEIPNFPVFKVKVFKVPLNPGESLAVSINSYRRYKTQPTIYPDINYFFENQRYFKEPQKNVPSKPVNIVYGFIRGKKWAFVSVVDLVKEGGVFYRYDNISFSLRKIPKRRREVFSSLPLNTSLDMIIITDSSLVEPFDSLAMFKTLRGIRTKVFTTDYIYSAFPGRTYEEKIRNFIKWAYTNWGIRFVLIGGSREVVPAPRIDMASADEYNYGYNMQSDAYYSALDGDWNYNGNYLLGELSDTIDIFPDVAVGRIPITDPYSAMEIVRRIIFYETHYLYAHPPKALLHASKFIVNNDACGYVSMMDPFISPYITTSQLCEQDTPVRDISMSELIDSLNNATIFWGFSHSNYRVFVVNIDSTTVVFQYHDIFRMNTDSTPLIWLHTGCLINSPNTNSLGAMIFKLGKSIASYGPQKESAPSIGINLVGNGFEGALNDSSGPYVGFIDVYAKIFAASLGYIESYIYESVSYGLIGDPSTVIYKSTPSTMSPTVSLVGDTLTISGAPTNALVVVVQNGVEILRDSVDAMGSLVRKLPLRGSGDIYIGINAWGYLPLMDTITVSSVSSLTLKNLSISSVFAGRNVSLTGWLKNTSSSAATSPFIKFIGLQNISSDSTTLPDIPPGDSVSFSLSLNIGRFVGNRNIVGQVIYGCSSCDTLIDTFVVMGKGPKLRFVGAYIDTSGGFITLKLLVYNEGGGPSDSNFAELYSGAFTMVSPGMYANLQPLKYTDTSFKVVLSGTYSGGSPLRLRIYNNFGDTVLARIILPDSLPPPPSVATEPGDGYIKVLWFGSANGYVIYRDSFVLNVVPGNWSFVKDMLSDGNLRCYSVAGIVEGVIGNRSPYYCNKPNPPKRFYPVDVLYPLHRTIPLAAQLDRTTPEYEIVFSSLYNTVQAYDYRGNLLWRYTVDSYPNLTEISASPAVGDVNGDGNYEVIFGIAGTQPGIIALDNSGNFLWKHDLPNAPVGVVVLGLYRGGRVPDIAFRAGPKIYFLSGDGSLINSCGNYQWRDDYISAGDIDRDGIWELIFASRDTLYVINTDCTNKPGFPKKMPLSAVRGTRIYDVDGDGYLDIIYDGGDKTYVVDRFGNINYTIDYINFSNFDVPMPLDWNGDGNIDLALLGSYFFEVRNLSGTLIYMQSGEPNTGGRLLVSGDIDGDGSDEGIFSDARSRLFVKGRFGDLKGYPIDLGHGDRYREEVVNGSSLIYDVDGDGKMELFAATNGNKFHGWNIGITGNIRWPMARGNRWNSGFPSFEMPDTNVFVQSYESNGLRKLNISLSKDGHIKIFGRKGLTVSIKIYSISGRKVFSKRILLSKGYAEVSPNLPRGIYFVEVKGKERILKKFIR